MSDGDDVHRDYAQEIEHFVSKLEEEGKREEVISEIRGARLSTS